MPASMKSQHVLYRIAQAFVFFLGSIWVVQLRRGKQTLEGSFARFEIVQHAIHNAANVSGGVNVVPWTFDAKWYADRELCFSDNCCRLWFNSDIDGTISQIDGAYAVCAQNRSASLKSSAARTPLVSVNIPLMVE
ncbi:MAG: hypothetical protein WDM89_08230 [Rhizomicrobium sp.]